MKQCWDIKHLGNVCENLDSRRIPITKNKRVRGNIPYYGASGIVDYVADYIFDEELLLVSEDGANLLARTYPIAFSISGKTWVNNHAHVLKFEEIDNHRFIEYYLNFIKLDDYVSGMAQPKLNQKMLKSILVPYPPLDEQKRIVAKLDQCFDAIDKAKTNVARNLQNAKELFQSQLNQIFTQKGEGWTEKKLREVCEKTSNIKWQDIQNTELQYIDLSAVSRDLLQITESVSVNAANAPSRAKKIIKKDDVIFATTRPTLKRVAKISNNFNNQICSTGYVVLRNIQNIIESDIIFYYLQTDMFMDRMESIQRGTSYPAVTDKDVKETVFSFPISTDEQKVVVRKLDELKSQTQSLESHYQQELDALDELKKSILQKAFRGEL